MTHLTGSRHTSWLNEVLRASPPALHTLWPVIVVTANQLLLLLLIPSLALASGEQAPAEQAPVEEVAADQPRRITGKNCYGKPEPTLGLSQTFGIKYGIGYMFFFWFEQFDMAQVLAWIITFVILMLILEHGVFARLESKAFAWRPVHQL